MTLAAINEYLKRAAIAANPKGDVRFGPMAKDQKATPLIQIGFPAVNSSVVMDRVKTVYGFTCLALYDDDPDKAVDYRQGANRPTKMQAIEQADALRVAFTEAVIEALNGLAGVDTGSVGLQVYSDPATLIGYQFTINVTTYGTC